MNEVMSQTELICPTCRLPLGIKDRAFACESGHNFDLAREGYVNLITGKAPSALQGDNAEMVRARRAFLEQGYYRPLARAVAEAVAGTEVRVIADFGCGEGYYLDQLMNTPGLKGVRAYGTDISKPAIAAAAKAYPLARWAVADTNRLIPLADGSVDAAINVFAPRNAAEFARVIRPGGRLVVAIPGAEHLANLRERFGLIGIQDDKPAKTSAQLSAFELHGTKRVKDEILLDASSLRDLLEMTPNARHLSEQARAEIDNISEIRTHIEFDVLIFGRR
jgi:23S rRNA (guanine745-N1)-methyltransferase